MKTLYLTEKHIRGQQNEDDIKCIISEIRPAWDLSGLHIEAVKGGLVNQCMCVSVGGNVEDAVMLKVWSEMDGWFIINRDKEVAASLIAQHVGCGPAVYAVFGNGMAIQYIPGRQLTWADLSNPSINRALAESIARLHSADLSRSDIRDRSGNKYTFPSTPALIANLRRALKHLPEAQEDPTLNARYQKEVRSRLPEISQDIDFLEKQFDERNLSVSLCHGDFYTPNCILYKGTVYLVDYESSDVNYCMIDLGFFSSSLTALQILGYEIKDTCCPDDDVLTSWLDTYRERVTTCHKDNSLLYLTTVWSALAQLNMGILPMINPEVLGLPHYLELLIIRLEYYFSKRHLIKELLQS